MSEEFKREIRYDVVKLKTGKKVNCVVVEEDWPEYEVVWRMLKDRMEGRPNALEASQASEAESREKLKVVTNLHAIEQDMRIAEEKLRRAAEASIKASQEQEPEFVDFEVYGYASDNARAESWCKETDWRVSEFLSIIGDNWEQNSTIRNVVFHHYAAPVTPPEIAELQRENAELRKLLESNVPEDVVNDAKRWKWYRDNGNHTCGAMQLEAWVDLHLSAQAKESKE